MNTGRASVARSVFMDSGLAAAAATQNDAVSVYYPFNGIQISTPPVPRTGSKVSS
jgi:hypothetical protein